MLLDGAEVLLLCSNNYLGLADHPRVRAAAGEAAERYGAGAGASRLISGSMSLHRKLEHRLATFKGAEAALLFGSGYLANIGIVSALAGRGEVVFSDELNHASIIDGCRLSRAETFVYRHRDTEHLAWGLREAGARARLIVTDGVFSMDGDVAPLAELVELARPPSLPARGRRGARRPGRSGPAGAARSPPPASTDEVDVIVGTLGKALGGYGAYVCGSRELVELLVNTARPFIYSTAPPPPSVGAALAALERARGAPGPGRAAAPQRRHAARGALGRGPGDRRLANPDRPGDRRRRPPRRWRSASARSRPASSRRRSARRRCRPGARGCG